LASVKDIYEVLNGIAPFSLVHDGDNSGLITGSFDSGTEKLLLTLDITNETVREAHDSGARVVVSHHPVIYSPLYSLSEDNPAALAFRLGIACICSHSPLDLACGGINDIMYCLLKEPFGLSCQLSVIEKIYGGDRGYGWVCETKTELSAGEMAAVLKDIFKCRIVRYTNSAGPVQKLAFCSGGAGSYTSKLISMGVDAYITGDLRNDQFITAKNAGMRLFDCGHFHTEVIVLEYLKNRFSTEFPELDVKIAETCRDPADYA